jgi:hypothetical protein
MSEWCILGMVGDLDVTEIVDRLMDKVQAAGKLGVATVKRRGTGTMKEECIEDIMKGMPGEKATLFIRRSFTTSEL